MTGVPRGLGGLSALTVLSGLIRPERRAVPGRRETSGRRGRPGGQEVSGEGVTPAGWRERIGRRAGSGTTARSAAPADRAGGEPASRSRPGPGPAGPARTAGSGLRAWAELLRLPALFTVPGDALAGVAAAGARPTPRTLLAIGSSLCLYEAGMALNDWADRAEDAVDRPHRPLPSGRVRPAAALAAAGGLTVAGLALASRAGRRPLAVAGALAATVWSYDLVLKRTPAGPLAMAAARGLDLLLGGVTAGGDTRKVAPSALTLATHTLAVTTVSRQETRGGSPWPPLTALATTTALTWTLTRNPRTSDGSRPGHTQPRPVRKAAFEEPLSAAPALGQAAATGTTASSRPAASRSPAFGELPFQGAPPRGFTLDIATLTGALTALYAATSARPLLHAVLNPSPPLTQRAVGGGIRAMIPLQAALAARSGAPVTALLTAALAPAARRFSRKVSVT